MGRSKIRRKQSRAGECGKALRRLVIDQLGGLTTIGRSIGVSRQLVDLWREKGVPLERCSEVANQLFGNYKLRWVLNFEAVFEYEKWKNAKITVDKYWKATIDLAPLDQNGKNYLMKLWKESKKQ